MAHPGDPDHRSQRDLSIGGLHPAQSDEGACKARLYPVLYLLYLAHRQARIAGLSCGNYRLSRARVFSPELFREYTRYPALSFTDRRAMDIQGAPCARGNAV